MARVLPLSGIRFDAGIVELGSVLAPPYDVISDAQREELYARDLRNIVRIDYGRPYPDDQPGVLDRYVRGAQHLQSWLSMGILKQDQRPSVYVTTHRFTAPDGSLRTRRGLYVRVPARPWETAEIIPHERTLRGPKEDRLALMRATHMQTSAVFGLWHGAPALDQLLARVVAEPPTAEAVAAGEMGPEQHQLWVVDDTDRVAAVVAALRPARLYIADGHHRYETAVAYAQERSGADAAADAGVTAGAAGAGVTAGAENVTPADHDTVLLYLCADDDPSIELFPTHRLVQPGPGVPGTLEELARRSSGMTLERHASLAEAVADAARRRDAEHAFAVQAPDGAGVLHAPRRSEGSPRERLDVVVLEDAVLSPACGLDAEAMTSGALRYTRDPADAERAVAGGEAALALCLNACTTDELIAVSDAGETMPQKSTYFYPKVPTGLVLSPL